VSEPIDGRRVTVMGLGRFGGGAGVTRWLVESGARVCLTDLRPADELASSLAGIEDVVSGGRVTLRLGGHDERDFRSCDLVVVNPAVPRPWENPLLAAARATGATITTEIGLVVERLDRRRVIGVTGTAGKSTTTAMIHHVLRRTGHAAHRGGNIGGSLLGDLPAIGAGDHVVLELSSAMLHWLGPDTRAGGAGWSPHVAVLTNLRPNHLDWHGSFEHYRASKLNIFASQRPGDHRVGGDDAGGSGPRIPLRLPGDHNQRNAQLAIEAAVRAAGILPADAAAALADFAGLPHRLQLVAERRGLSFFDDSKSTTPEATVLAVEAFGAEAAVHLIAGGYDKEIDLDAIAALAPRLRGMYTIGTTGRRLAERAASPDRAFYVETLGAAVARALDRMHPGETLLLSPGCASWDQFENYEARGRAFTRLVEAALGG
jgi:UDP-N-acetylmuramoylalanine--D-glutamate ligase